jgi:mono/diheme cytochrome c family protein
MKKIVLLLSFVVCVFGTDGFALFKKHCISCHILKKGKYLTKQEKANMSAPPAFGISKHVKERYGNKDVFVNFIDKYIQKPQESISICKKQVIKSFGLMPPIGASLTQEERKSVSLYLYNLTK